VNYRDLSLADLVKQANAQGNWLCDLKNGCGCFHHGELLLAMAERLQAVSAEPRISPKKDEH